MSNILDRKKELYKKQRYLRDLTMASSSYKQKQKIREEQDKLYKQFKFYQGLSDVYEKKRKSK